MRRKGGDEDVAKELDEMKKDPRKWKEFIAKAEMALEHWHGRKKR